MIDRGEVQALILRINTASPTTCGPAGPARAGDRRRHRLEHGRHRPQLRGRIAAGIREDILVERFQRLTGAGPSPEAGSNCEPGPGSTRTWKAAILRARRDRHRGHARHPAADQHGRGPRKGDRHHGADHGHADHARGVHPRQDRCPSP